jgi:hypothetical protein
MPKAASIWKGDFDVARLPEIGPVAFAEVTSQAFEPSRSHERPRSIPRQPGLPRPAREKNAHAPDYAGRSAGGRAAEKTARRTTPITPERCIRRDFPIVGYSRPINVDAPVQWICTTFSKNPIGKVDKRLLTSPVFGAVSPTVPPC